MDKILPLTTLKVVIAGPFSSGKTEFIKTISEIDVVSTERALRRDRDRMTVAMDFGRVTVDDSLVLYLFGAPGARRFDFMWEILADGMLGFIVTVDSRRPETFCEARSIAQTMMAYAPIPCVFAANKQDSSEAWDVDAIRIALRVEPEIPIVPCIATDRDSVKGVLLTLLHEVLQDVNEEASDV